MRLKQKIRNNSLALRLLLTATAALTLSLFFIPGVGYGTGRFISDGFGNSREHWELQRLLRNLKFNASGRPESLFLSGDVAWAFQAFPEDIKYRVIDRQGRVLLSSETEGKALAPTGKSFDPLLKHFEMGEAGRRLHGSTVDVGAAKGLYFLQVASSRRLDFLLGRAYFFGAKRATISVFICAILVFGLALLFTFRRMLKPVRRLSAQAAAITPRSLHVRLSLDGIPGEVRPLVESFNKTLNLLERGYQQQQEFLASAAHELKTPLALIRAQVELSDGHLDKKILLRDIDLMTRQVHQLLHLAELSEIDNYQFASIDPLVVACDVTRYLERLAALKPVLLGVCNKNCPEMVLADRSALFVLLKNLLENAIHHAPKDSLVSVTLSGHEIAVRDEGDGIPDEYMPNLFIRFWRGPGSHYEGAGLGLAICREIALAHGWTLKARNAVVGNGAVFVLVMTPEKS